MRTRGKILEFVTGHTEKIFRVVLFIAFIGHGLVSLNFSPGYALHYNLLSAVNFTGIETEKILLIQGFFDLALAVLLLSGYRPRLILTVTLVYISGVCIAGWKFFYDITDSLFGFAEMFRRLPWILLSLFLLRKKENAQAPYWLLRTGISFAFLAHGIASLGFLGLRGGHIELSSQLFSETVATQFVFYSGFSDTLLGLMLLLGLGSRLAAAIGSAWLVFIVFLSSLIALPDAIFRTGFLITALYVAMDPRCHQPSLLSLIRKNKIT